MKPAVTDLICFRKASLLLSIIFFSFLYLFISCDTPVAYDNPFDPAVGIPPPSDLRIDSIKEMSVSLSWKNNFTVSGREKISLAGTAILYNYYEKFFPIDTAKGLASSITISRIFEPNPHNGAVYFRVYSLVGSRTSGESNTVSTQMPNTTPVPSNLAATLINRTTVRLGWQDNSKSESYFQIERKLSGQDVFIVLSQSPANTTSFSDTTLNYQGDTVYYRICAAFENTLYSPYATTSFCAPLAAPTLTTVSTINNTSVQLSWKNNVRFGDGFIIERAEQSGSFVEINRVSPTDSSYIDMSPDTMKEYIYRIKLFAGTKTSDPSNSFDLGFWPIPKYVRGTSGNYNDIAVSPDYSLLALTGNGNGDISVVNSADLQMLMQFHNANLDVQSVDISASNEYLAAGLVDNIQNTGRIRIWRLSDGALWKEWNGFNPVQVVRFSPDGSLLACDGYAGPGVVIDSFAVMPPGPISIIDLQNDTIVRSFSGEKNIAFSPNQSFVAVEGTTCIAYVWAMLDGSQKNAFNWWDKKDLNGLKFFNDGRWIAAITTDEIFIWDINQSPGLIGILTNITSIVCSDLTPDNQFLVICTGNQISYIVKVNGWYVDGWHMLRVVSSTHPEFMPRSLSCLPNGRLIIAGTAGLKEYYLQKQWTSPASFN